MDATAGPYREKTSSLRGMRIKKSSHMYKELARWSAARDSLQKGLSPFGDVYRAPIGIARGILMSSFSMPKITGIHGLVYTRQRPGVRSKRRRFKWIRLRHLLTSVAQARKQTHKQTDNKTTAPGWKSASGWRHARICFYFSISAFSYRLTFVLAPETITLMLGVLYVYRF